MDIQSRKEHDQRGSVIRISQNIKDLKRCVQRFGYFYDNFMAQFFISIEKSQCLARLTSSKQAQKFSRQVGLGRPLSLPALN